MPEQEDWANCEKSYSFQSHVLWILQGEDYLLPWMRSTMQSHESRVSPLEMDFEYLVAR